MDKDQIAHKTAIDKFISVVTDPDNVNDINAISDCPALVQQLQAKQTDINTAIDKQSITTVGLTDHAKAMREDMAHEVIKICHKAIPKAQMAGREDLAALLDHEKTFLTHGPIEIAISNSRNIVKGISDNPAIFNNITPQDFTNTNNAIANCDAAKNETGITIDLKKVEGTEAIITGIKEAFIIIHYIYDFVYGEYIDTNKALVDKLGEAMDIEIEGVRHTSITAICLDADAPEGASNLLQGVLMEMTDINRTAISDHYGIATIIKFKPGWQHLKFSKAGFVSNETSSILKRGKSLTIEVMMKRV